MKMSRSVSSAVRRAPYLLVAAAVLSATPARSHAQTGKWIAVISQLQTVGGSADLTVDPRNDKQSRAKISLRNIKRDMRLSWDIVAGRCREEGASIAPLAAFQAVQTAMDGSGTATANTPKLEPGKAYYVRVFDPQTAPTDATAYGCANLSEKP